MAKFKPKYCTYILSELRMVKELDEIECIRYGAINAVSPGMTK